MPSQVPLSLPLGGGISLDVQAGTNIASTVGVLIRPSGISVKYPFEPGTTLPSAGIGAAFDFAPQTATLLLGAPNNRIAIGGDEFMEHRCDLSLRAGGVSPRDFVSVAAATPHLKPRSLGPLFARAAMIGAELTPAATG